MPVLIITNILMRKFLDEQKNLIDKCSKLVTSNNF